MANYHLTVKMISRTGGKICVSALAYRTATKLTDLKTGETYDYTHKGFVGHVDILTPKDSPEWICEIVKECETSRQSALQKLSNVFEAAEKRKDAQVYREVEFSLPNELTDEQNIKWAKEFIHEVCVRKGMVSITCFHFDIDKKTGINKPHCHTLLSTRNLSEEGFQPLKNLEWNHESLVHELRQQYEQYQNMALKENGYEVRVDHRSYDERGLVIDPQPKLNSAIIDMAARGIKTEKQANFDMVRLRNQFKILKDPELVFSIVTSNHSTFTRYDIARVLNRYIDDPDQFRTLHDRLLGSNKIIHLNSREGEEPVYTTKEMLRIELGLVTVAEHLSAQKTHNVEDTIIDTVIANQSTKLAKHEGRLSADQDQAIRHMLKSEQLSCVVGYAGSGKTTSLEAAREAWEASGYKVLGLAPTGRAARNMEGSGIRSITVHKFLLAQGHGREQISNKSVVVLDEAGMVDSRRFSELLTIVERAGAKIVAMGDGNQLQAIEAGPAFRLLMDRIQVAVLETIVRQKEEWQKEATRLFGSEQASKALGLYMEKGLFKIIEDKGPEFRQDQLVDKYCLARQMSGRVWKEMLADYEKEYGKVSYNEIDFEILSKHQDFDLYVQWKGKRQALVESIVANYSTQKTLLEERGVDIPQFEQLASQYKIAGLGEKGSILREAESILRIMSYENVCDTRVETKQALVDAWANHRAEKPEESHLMLAFTNKDALSLNETARQLMREQGAIKGKDFTFETRNLEEDDFGREVIIKQERSFAQGDRLLFTHNDNSLDVKNGTLGTIISVNKSKIVVAVDGQEEQQVSFAPKLYPYIDLGWATNISKSQGISVDHVKKLASFEENRNLAYVGMSRHRNTLEIYGSSLDFWRDEKVMDRLSRVQEKLSGYDYLDVGKIQELIKEDTEVIWHQQMLQQGRDLWNAIKGTSMSAVDQLLERSQEKIVVDPLPVFEHSEEKRSTAFFKENTPLDNTSNSIIDKEIKVSSNSVLEKANPLTQGKNPEEAEVLTYLQNELSSEKHSWLKEGLAQKLLNLADEDPYKALKEWQEISDDYSFKPTQPAVPLTKEQQEAYKFQETEVLAYLQDEISTEKHTWLKEGFAQKLLDLAGDNPFKALKEWQEISDDYSFKPSVPEALMSKEELELKKNILCYLQEEVRPEKHEWLDREDSRNLLEMAKNKPLQALQEWQEVSKDYRFNPYKESLTDREINVQEYMQQKILDEGHRFSKEKYTDLASTLLDKPLETYQKWQLYTGDQTFDPASGVPKIEIEAQMLMSKVKELVTADAFKNWQDNLTHTPETIIKECNDLLQAHQHEVKLEMVAQEFISLSERYEKTSRKDPQRNEIEDTLSSIAEAYLKDERFIEKIESSQSEAALSRVAQEIQNRERTISRGMNYDM